jgi:hypothetical protein
LGFHFIDITAMNQNQLHRLAGILCVSGGLSIASGILLFNPELVFGGTILTFTGAFVTLCMLEQVHYQER